MNPLLAEAEIAAIHSPDEEVRAMVAVSLQALAQVPQHLDTWQSSLAQNLTLAECLQLDAGQIARCRQLGRSLCDQGEFLLALPLTLYCAAFASDIAEHSFLAAACLQRLGQAAQAAHFYRVALQLNGADAASAYRLGECLEAIGQPEDACHLYQWAIELARGNFAQRRLQDMAHGRLARLKRG
jgi:tetratricopeptide (TPR) repeat protein